jgi:hypothetical protein
VVAVYRHGTGTDRQGGIFQIPHSGVTGKTLRYASSASGLWTLGPIPPAHRFWIGSTLEILNLPTLSQKTDNITVNLKLESAASWQIPQTPYSDM